MQFSYWLTGYGWAMASVAGGGQEVEFTVSHLSDTVSALLHAVAEIQAGATFASASWEQEPGECRWQLYRSGGEVTVAILRFDSQWPRAPDSEGALLFSCHGRVADVASAIASGFRATIDALGESGYDRWWYFPFPLALLDQVEQAIR